MRSRPRESLDFTVPLRTLSTSAVSASPRSRKKRHTTARRCSSGQASDGVEKRAPTLAFEDRRLGGRGRVPRATLFSRAKREAFVAA